MGTALHRQEVATATENGIPFQRSEVWLAD